MPCQSVAWSFPELVVGLHPAIVTALAKNITQASLTVHILEFFSQLAGIEVFRHDSRNDEVKTILGVCIQLLHRSRERDARIVEQSKSQAFLSAGPGQERAATPSREARPVGEQIQAATLSSIDCQGQWSPPVLRRRWRTIP